VDLILLRKIEIQVISLPLQFIAETLSIFTHWSYQNAYSINSFISSSIYIFLRIFTITTAKLLKISYHFMLLSISHLFKTDILYFDHHVNLLLILDPGSISICRWTGYERYPKKTLKMEESKIKNMSQHCQEDLSLSCLLVWFTKPLSAISTNTFIFTVLLFQYYKTQKWKFLTFIWHVLYFLRSWSNNRRLLHFVNTVIIISFLGCAINGVDMRLLSENWTVIWSFCYLTEET
jgi:hypothetical protein